MVIVKHETHHIHDFVVKFVIFNVNRVNFYQEQCTVTLIQRKRRSKNRLGAETIAALLLTRRSCLTLTRCSCSRCECTHLLTCTAKKYALLTRRWRLRCETGVTVTTELLKNWKVIGVLLFEFFLSFFWVYWMWFFFVIGAVHVHITVPMGETQLKGKVTCPYLGKLHVTGKCGESQVLITSQCKNKLLKNLCFC